MEKPQDIWHGLAEHWTNWGVYAFLLGISNFATWILSSRKFWKDWKASRQAKKERKIDLRILEALGDPTLWPQPRAMTGSGIPYVRTLELAKQLSLDSETVGDSLERLEERGRVERSNGTLAEPAPCWRVILR